MSRPDLPPLPLEEWEETKLTLHLFCQVLGKIRMALMPKKNHWWHVPLYPSARGLTTRAIALSDGDALEIELDFRSHVARLMRTRRGEVTFPLEGRTVAAFYGKVVDAMGVLEVEAEIVPRPFDMDFDTPFPDDEIHGDWDSEAVERWWRILLWTAGVLEEFSGRFRGKQTPVHLFWHSFDLALTRFNGARAPEMPEADPVSREAYSDEVVSMGFWAGDDDIPEPTYYAYTWPEPEGLVEQPLAGPGARWHDTGRGHLALLSYGDLRVDDDPRAGLLAFLESAYRAGASLRGWDLDGLRYEWTT